MTPLHIIGQPGSGKTTLVVDLIQGLCRRKLSVGSIKHSTHTHELDKKGKDSYRHRKAGAGPVTMMTRDMAAIYMEKPADMSPSTILESPLYSNLDIALIEGWISGPYDKIEVWRCVVDREPLFLDVPGVKILVTDDDLEPSVRKELASKKILLLKRNDPTGLVTQTARLAGCDV